MTEEMLKAKIDEQEKRIEDLEEQLKSADLLVESFKNMLGELEEDREQIFSLLVNFAIKVTRFGLMRLEKTTGVKLVDELL